MSDDEQAVHSHVRMRYHALRRQRPDWFINHPGGFEILFRDDDIDRAEDAAWHELQESYRRGEIGGPVYRNWVTVGVIAEDSWGVVIRDAVRAPDGNLGVYRREMSAPDRPPGIVALTTLDGRMAILRHYRHALRRFSWEFPRGFARPGESCEGTVQRQLKEEIRATAQHIQRLGSLDPDGGRLGDSVFLVSAAIDQAGEVERAEAIERYELIDLEELQRRVASNEITDALTLAAIGKAYCCGLFHNRR